MSLKKIIKAMMVPEDLYGTYALFRKLGYGIIDSFKCAVECIVTYHFALI